MTDATQTENKKPDPFCIDPAPVPWPVDVRVAVAGGGFEVRRFTALVNVLSEDEHAALDAAAKPTAAPAEGEAAPPNPPEPTRVEILARNAERFPHYIAGWGEDVLDAAGQPVPYSVDALRALVTGKLGMAVSAGLWTAIAEVRLGVRLGNFAAPPVTG